VVLWSEFLATQRICIVLPVRYELNLYMLCRSRPPLWSSGQSSWLQILRPRIPFPALPHLPRSSGSGTRSTQHRKYNRGAIWNKKNSGSGLEIREYGRRDPSCRPRGNLYPQNFALTSPTSCSRSVGSSLADSGHGVICTLIHKYKSPLNEKFRFQNIS
jgi:hypothetical protein